MRTIEGVVRHIRKEFYKDDEAADILRVYALEIVERIVTGITRHAPFYEQTTGRWWNEYNADHVLYINTDEVLNILDSVREEIRRYGGRE